MPPAARIGDMHTCPMVTGLVPHVGGPIVVGMPTVMIGFMPAARVGDMAVCVGPPDAIAKGAPTVLIGGMPAARIGDLTVHGGVIVMGCPTVIIGEAGSGGGGGGGGGGGDAGAGAGAGPAPAAPAPPATDEETIDQAIEIVRNSAFAQTEEGRRVLAAIERLRAEGRITFQDLPDTTRGQWSGEGIGVNSDYNRDPEATASELVHEGTHEVDNGEHPSSRSIDEEMRTNNNQLDLYEEQRERGFRDPALESRRTAREDGTLRDNVRGRYPELPEHSP